MTNRGWYNIDYQAGFNLETELFKDYLPLLKKILNADVVDLVTRGLIDKAAGTDAIALIEGKVYGISLRFRTSDYDSFTLNRHISDKYSEVHKWKGARSNTIKPAYFIQVANTSNHKLKVIRVNIDAFGYYLLHLEKTDQLEQYYKSHLKSYEFPLQQLSNVTGIWSKEFTLYDIV